MVSATMKATMPLSPSPRRFLGKLPCLMATACVCLTASCGNGAGYDVRLRFDPADLAQSVDRLVLVVVEDCNGESSPAEPPSTIVAERELRRGEATSGFGSVEPGSYGLYARGRDADCRVVVAGCTPVTVVAGGRGELVVTLQPVEGPLCPQGERCVDGRCLGSSGDAAVPMDASTEDEAGPGDAAGPDGPDDASALDGRAPDADAGDATDADAKDADAATGCAPGGITAPIEVFDRSPDPTHTCSIDRVFVRDEQPAGLDRLTAANESIAGRNVTACVGVEFAEATPLASVTVRARAVGDACGGPCRDSDCGTGRFMLILESANGVDWAVSTGGSNVPITDSFEDYTVSLPAAGQKRYFLVCRTAESLFRDDILVDSILGTCR